MCNNKNCQLCPNLIVSTAVAIAGGQLQVTIPETTFKNQQKVCLVIAQAIPVGTTSDVVTIMDVTTEIPLVDKCFNYVRADQVKSRRVYNLRIAADIPVAVVTSCNLCPTSYVVPSIPLPVAPATLVAKK